MAGHLPSFLNSARLVIKIGNSTIAYATSLNFSDDMTNVPVGGIGSFNFQANEPVGYLGRGSMVITQYSQKVLNQLTNSGTSQSRVPSNINVNPNNVANADGNSMLNKEYFSPLDMIAQRTFDIDVYERKNKSPESLDLRLIYTLQDCRMTGYNLSFTPGQLLNESVSFLCLRVVDHISETASTKLYIPTSN